MTTTPQNTSNSGSELDDILDDALNTIQAYVQDEIQDDNGYPPFYGDGETFGRVKSEAIAAINRLYIKRSDVVEVMQLEPSDWDENEYACNYCRTYIEDPEPGEPRCFCEMRNKLRQEQRNKLGLSANKKGKP